MPLILGLTSFLISLDRPTKQTPCRLASVYPIITAKMTDFPEANSFGFYVFQSSIGTPLQFHPKLGTPELDNLIDAYLPYPAPMQEKRATVSIDFFEHFRCTGQHVKFYPVVDNFIHSLSSSPGSLEDSGYGSSFTPSPLAPTWSWGLSGCSPVMTTPSASSIFSASQPSDSCTTQPPSNQPASSHYSPTDLSHLPGMRILTKDGQDVTNAAPRGCKTKEQRDHAHLMRIMKACDSCRRKKVRCDPSHRNGFKNSAADLHLATAQARQVKNGGRNRRIRQPSLLEARQVQTPSSHAPTTLLSPPAPAGTTINHSSSSSDVHDIWDEFIQFSNELNFPGTDIPEGLRDLSVFASTVPTEPTLVEEVNRLAPPSIDPDNQSALTSPKLPYLFHNNTPHSYADFDLYSPLSNPSDYEPVFAGDPGTSDVASGATSVSHHLELTGHSCSKCRCSPAVHFVPSNQSPIVAQRVANYRTRQPPPGLIDGVGTPADDPRPHVFSWALLRTNKQEHSGVLASSVPPVNFIPDVAQMTRERTAISAAYSHVIMRSLDTTPDHHFAIPTDRLDIDTASHSHSHYSMESHSRTAKSKSRVSISRPETDEEATNRRLGLPREISTIVLKSKLSKHAMPSPLVATVSPSNSRRCKDGLLFLWQLLVHIIVLNIYNVFNPINYHQGSKSSNFRISPPGKRPLAASPGLHRRNIGRIAAKPFTTHRYVTLMSML